MIYFLTTASHMYTHRVISGHLPAFRQMSYPIALARRSLPKATYVFSDLDRLSPWQLELAARLYRQLREAGAKVYNDPAQVLHRLPLLKRLQRAGINSFNAWGAEDLDLVDRYPVFIRTRHAHRGVLSDLIHDAGALSAELARARTQGFTMSDLIVVEYCGEPIRAGLFRKHSVYRVGDRYVSSTSVHEGSWMAKFGQMGIADQALYDEELRQVFENPFAKDVAPAFELANIEYGRVDFSVVGGRVEIYEINTNPHMYAPPDHPFPARVEASKRVFQDLLDSIRQLDSLASDARISIQRAPEVTSLRRRFGLLPGYQWSP